MKKPEDIMLWRFLKEMAQRETVDYVVQELRQCLGEDVPTAEEVRRYLLNPVDTDGLNAHQQALVMDQLLECAEVNFRTLCGLIRYRYFKSAGLVNSVEEFLALAHPDERTDLKEEEPR